MARFSGLARSTSPLDQGGCSSLHNIDHMPFLGVEAQQLEHPDIHPRRQPDARNGHGGRYAE